MQAIGHAWWRFPWREAALTLRERVQDDRLALTAGSLTFTTMISLVPLFTVALAIFSAFPMFARMENMLQKWLVQSLIPDNIARQVMNYLVQFSSKAGQMGWFGALILLVTALSLILTIDRKLNDIWRVRQLRPLAQRVLVYWALLTLGPLLLGLSLSFSSYAVSLYRGWMEVPRRDALVVLDVVQFALAVLAMTLLYRYVPNARVRWAHAFSGALMVSLGMEAGQRLLAWYLEQVPTYSLVYGTFATLPILLIWVYLSWLIVLMGAVLVAHLPSLLAGLPRPVRTPGAAFRHALQMLAHLDQAQRAQSGGLSLEHLAQRLRLDAVHLEGPLEALLALDWVGRLDEGAERHVLLIDPHVTPLAPLLERLLLRRLPDTDALWCISGWSGLMLQQVLPPVETATAV